MTHVVVDPVTRIEGHLRIEAEVDGGVVKDAWSSSTMFRGVELILKGRDPRDAWAFTQRICGVCTTVHAIASIRAVENAIGAAPPPNARLLRNLIIGAQCVQDHVIHFYHLHALDWVDIVSALSADPAQTATLAQSISDWPLSGPKYFAGVRDRIKAFVDRGQLGPFANAYWGHPAYRLPPEVDLIAVSHYLDALDFQRNYARVHAILGGKSPHLQTYVVGGMALPIDPASAAALNADALQEVDALLRNGLAFVRQAYLPDLLAIASYYREWGGIGRGVGNYLAFGDFSAGPPERGLPIMDGVLPSGVIRNADLSRVEPVEPSRIAEHVTRSWFRDRGAAARSPYDGVTEPHYTGPAPPYEHLDVDGKYSWLKAPRYDGTAVEVGPLARVLIGYARGDQRFRRPVDRSVAQLGVPP